jgi:hypothetical protein
MTDYSDLLERLRDYRAYLGDCLEAADVIERLLARIAELKEALKPFADKCAFRRYVSSLMLTTIGLIELWTASRNAKAAFECEARPMEKGDE